MTLNELAARVEAAEGPDRELDGEIAKGIGWVFNPDTGISGFWRSMWLNPEGHADYRGPPRYTASLDAAMSLVPEGAHWHCGRHSKTGKHPRTGTTVDGGGDAYLTPKNACEPVYTMAATPALALVAACLRARATEEEK